jgi:hypothetical protein
MNTIKLTPAELELIQVKRQQEELAAIEAAANKKIAIEQEVARVKLAVDSYIKRDAQQVKAAGEYALQIPTAGFHIDTRDCSSNVTYQGEVVDTINYQEQVAYMLKDGYKISVREHIVHSKYSYRGRSQGYKMYVSGRGIDYKVESRGYKNPKKVVELIEDTIKSIKAEELAAVNQKNAVETTIAMLTQQFPEAQVVSSRGCKINPYGNPSNRYTEYDKVEVKLANGVKIEYRVHSNGYMERLGITFPKHDTMELVSMLNGLEFPTETVA